MKKILATACALALMLGAASCVKNNTDQQADESTEAATDAQTGATTQQPEYAEPCDSAVCDTTACDGVAVGDEITTASGLKYRVIKQGEGPSPLPTSVATVKYTGKFTNGQVFDSSDGQTIEFPLNGVIAGFSEGLQLMNRGAVYELTIPGNLAYGEQGIPGVIAPNETLVFELELVDFR